MSIMFEKQKQFFVMLGLLYQRAADLNLPLKLGCGLCHDPHHSQHSLHHDSLAQDLPMVWPDGRYGTWEDYLPLGLYWEALGGTWGGRFDLNMDGIPKDDANHFSLAHNGRR